MLERTERRLQCDLTRSMDDAKEAMTAFQGKLYKKGWCRTFGVFLRTGSNEIPAAFMRSSTEEWVKARLAETGLAVGNSNRKRWGDRTSVSAPAMRKPSIGSPAAVTRR